MNMARKLNWNVLVGGGLGGAGLTGPKGAKPREVDGGIELVKEAG